MFLHKFNLAIERTILQCLANSHLVPSFTKTITELTGFGRLRILVWFQKQFILISAASPSSGQLLLLPALFPPMFQCWKPPIHLPRAAHPLHTTCCTYQHTICLSSVIQDLHDINVQNINFLIDSKNAGTVTSHFGKIYY